MRGAPGATTCGGRPCGRRLRPGAAGAGALGLDGPPVGQRGADAQNAQDLWQCEAAQ